LSVICPQLFVDVKNKSGKIAHPVKSKERFCKEINLSKRDLSPTSVIFSQLLIESTKLLYNFLFTKKKLEKGFSKKSSFQAPFSNLSVLHQ